MAIVAWIGLKVVSLALGAGLGFAALSSRSSKGGINPEVGRAVAFVSLGLAVFILLLLVADGKYLIAACLAGAAIAVPLVVQAANVSIAVKSPIPGQRGGYGLNRPTARGGRQAGELLGAAVPAAELYAALLPESATRPRSVILAEGIRACSLMTTRARVQLERAMLHRPADRPTGCAQALAVAGRRNVHGPRYLTEGELLSRLSVGADEHHAVFLAGNGIDVELVAVAAGRWRIGGFSGRAFTRR